MMLPRKSSVRRRPILLVLSLLAGLYLIVSFGPPLTGAPAVSEAGVKASKWAHSIESDLTAIYHTTSSPNDNPAIRQATMLFEGDKDHLRNMYDRSLATHLAHGERWGVPTHVLKQFLVAEGSYFNKPAWLMNLVMNEMTKPKQRRAEWIVWFDADSIVMNQEIPWSTFIAPSDFADKHILATRDNNGFNAGMMILRVHEWTVNMLAEAVALKALVPNVELPFHDQSAIVHVCERVGNAEHFIYQPRHWWNRYHHDPNGEEVGNMIIHFAGISSILKGSDTKIEIMTKWLEKVEQKPREWTRAIGQTKYEQEVDDYWNMLRRSRKLLDEARAKQEKGVPVDRAKQVEEKVKDLVHVVLKWADDADKMSEANRRLESALKG